jgi:hypothetical protein
MKPVLALILLMVSVAGAAPVSRPSIVLIVADDLGRHDLGCTGSIDSSWKTENSRYCRLR